MVFSQFLKAFQSVLPARFILCNNSKNVYEGKFGMTAKQWWDKNPDKTGNTSDVYFGRTNYKSFEMI